jgi:hypothetical protein
MTPVSRRPVKRSRGTLSTVLLTQSNKEASAAEV